VYPNPFKNNITIDLNPDLNYIKVSVLNSQGRLIQEVSSPDQFLDDQLRLQINEGAGTYILVIESKEGVDVKRALQLDN